MVRRKFLVPSTYDEIIDDPETGLVAGVFYPKKKKPSLRRRLWSWITGGWKATSAEAKQSPPAAAHAAGENPPSAELP